MKKLKRNYLFIFLFVSTACFSQSFSEICKNGTLNEIIQAINNNSDKNEKSNYEKEFSKYANELNTSRYLLDSLNNNGTGINKNDNINSIYAAELKNNQNMINSLLNTHISNSDSSSATDNYYEMNPLLNNKNTDITSQILGKDANNLQSNQISKNVIDALKYNPNLSSEDKKQILKILSMR